MTERTQDLLLEHLRALRADVSGIRRDVLESRVRMASLEGHAAATHKGLSLVHEDMAGLNLRMDGVSERLERLERRLELS